MATDVLTVADVSKRFGAVTALTDVSFALAAGEIRAVCGENGAGKSTLVKILMGLVTPDTGTITLDGVRVEIRSAQQAQSLGLGLVAQELSLAPRLSIVDNIWLGSPRVPLVYRIPHLRQAAANALGLLGVGDWNLDTPVAALSIGQRQIVEIARLLARDARVLILDEPTATLNDSEIERLLTVLKRLKAEGRSVIYISHRLGEVFELCDSVTVLRNGAHVATMRVGLAGRPRADETKPVAEVTRAGLVELMLGRSFKEMYPASQAATADATTSLQVTNLVVPGSVHGLSFAATRGRILGLAGQIGSGASAVTRALAGLVPDARGEVLVAGRPLTLGSAPSAVAHGIVFLSEDRAGEGLFHQLAVAENMVAQTLARFRPRGLLDWTGLKAEAGARGRRVGVDPSRLAARAGTLSGGNQQKTLFGRALKSDTTAILLLNEPTRGIDVGARADIYQLMRQLCGAGYTLVVTSSDLEELTAMSDRIITLYRGRAVAAYDGAAIDAAQILIDITHPTVAA